jgi:LysM repeat protein
MKKTFLFIFALFLGSVLMISCSAKRVENTEVPQQPAQTAAEPTPDTTMHYTVQPKDTLWGIAGKSTIYGDSFQWPLLFKANRDKIQDPDLIYPAQDFEINKSVASDEVEKAKKLASETGKYKEHAKPRKKLPVDYF